MKSKRQHQFNPDIIEWWIIFIEPEWTVYSSLPLSTVLLSMVSRSTRVWKYLVENSRNKQFTSFKLCAVLHSTMKPPSSLGHKLSLSLPQPLCIRYSPGSHLAAVWAIGPSALRSPSSHSVRAPELTSGGAGTADTPKRGRKWKGESSKYIFRGRDKDHIHITFIKVYCC